MFQILILLFASPSYEDAVKEIVTDEVVKNSYSLPRDALRHSWKKSTPWSAPGHDHHRIGRSVHISWSPRYNRKNRFVGVLQELPAWRSSRQVRFHRGSGLLLFSSLRDYGFLPPFPWRPPTTWSSIPAEGIDEIATPKAKRRTKNGEKHVRIYAPAPTRSAFLLQTCLHNRRERLPQRVCNFILEYVRRNDKSKKRWRFIKLFELNGVSEECALNFENY